jgi:hypothetical protein
MCACEFIIYIYIYVCIYITKHKEKIIEHHVDLLTVGKLLARRPGFADGAIISGNICTHIHTQTHIHMPQTQ